VHWTEIVFGTLLVVLLLGLAGYYGWRQISSLRALRASSESPAEEQRYLRRRAWRRLVGCGFMVIVAVLLGGLLLFLEAPGQQLADLSEPWTSRGENPDLTPEQRQFRTLYTCWIIGLLLAVLAMLVMAAWDMLATRRFGLTQFRRIQADRRAMIERQAARMRQQRNGHQG
jgi:ABC-type Fe3+ transport system permease subunit